MLAYAVYTSTFPFLSPSPIVWTPGIGNYNYLNTVGTPNTELVQVPSTSITFLRVSLNMGGEITANIPPGGGPSMNIQFQSNGGAGFPVDFSELGFWQFALSAAPSAFDVSVSELYVLDSAGLPSPGPLVFSATFTQPGSSGFYSDALQSAVFASLTLMSWTTP